MLGIRALSDREILSYAAALFDTPSYCRVGIAPHTLRRYIRKQTPHNISEPLIEKILQKHWRCELDDSNVRRYFPNVAEQPAFGSVALDARGLPILGTPDYGEYPQLPAGALVMGDFHSVAYDPDWLAQVVEKARALQIKRAILNGDLFDFTFFSKFGAERRWTTEQEIDVVRAIVNWIAARFDTVHILPGNHDKRISKKLDHEVSTDYLLVSLLSTLGRNNVHVHWHHHAFVGQTWLVAHPKNYSAKPIAPADAYIAKHRRHVAISHTHQWGIARYNGFWAVEIGTMSNPGKFAYAHEELNKSPAAERGALIITDDEKPILLHPELP